MLKGQDIALITKILIKQKEAQKIEFQNIAYELYISNSEVSKGFQRLVDAKIISKYSDGTIEIHKHALSELFYTAIKYFFSPKINIAIRGIPTAYSSTIFKKKISNNEQYVWPYINGNSKGLALTPIYKTLPNAVERTPDEIFYNVMCALDLIRINGSREIKVAQDYLEEFIWN